MIKNGTELDAEKIAKLKIENYKETYANIFPNSFLNKMSFEKEKIKYIEGLKNRKVLLYYDEDKILGYVYYGKRKNHKEVLPNYDGEIYAIYVDVNYQNKGIGTKLIKSALYDLMNDYKKIILWCIDDNLQAMQFYKNKNFKKSDKIEVEVGGKILFERAFLFNFEESNKYELTRFVSYKEKDNVIAVYSNFNILFLKDDTVKWFKSIVNQKETNEIPISFYEYLIKKEVIEIA